MRTDAPPLKESDTPITLIQKVPTPTINPMDNLPKEITEFDGIEERPKRIVFTTTSLYKPEYCQMLIDYFNRPHIKILRETTVFKDGTEKIKETQVPNDLPLFEGFAVRVANVNVNTLKRWAKRHREFGIAYKRAKNLQKDMIANLTLKGMYNATFAIFLAKNITDLKDEAAEALKSINIGNVILQVNAAEMKKLRKPGKEKEVIDIV